MTGFSQSALLQALGWATLNSFWQVGILWCLFVLARRLQPLSPELQYRLAVFSLLLAFSGFAGSLILFYTGHLQFSGPLSLGQLSSNAWFSAILTVASLAYLLLLFVPVSRLASNWGQLRRLRRSQLTKAPVQYRLFVQKIAPYLGLRQPVKVYLSALVQSPLTIGYLKPLILLPVASFNHLSIQQAEAILLHELAHIRRSDFPINIFISIVHTLLYFNPFVRMFVRVAENARETCCDRLVLQFGYEGIAYAGALLQLEKLATPLPQLALGATGKSQLLTRIESIVGMPARLPRLQWVHFAGLLASTFFILALHSLIVNNRLPGANQFATIPDGFANPFSLAHQEVEAMPMSNKASKQLAARKKTTQIKAAPVVIEEEAYLPAPDFPAAPPPPPPIVQVAHTEAPMEQLAAEEQEQVAQAVATTQKALATLAWENMNNAMADALSDAEKAKAQEQYQQELSAINWKRMADNLASRYHQTNWDALNTYLNGVRQQIQLDSTIAATEATLSHLSQQQLQSNPALPDHSVKEVETLRMQLRRSLDSLQALKQRPVVKF